MQIRSVSDIVKTNVQGRVFSACRAQGVVEPARIAIYARAVQDAVNAASRATAGGDTNLDAVLTEQLVLLGGALATASALRSVIESSLDAPRSAAVTTVEDDALNDQDRRSAPAPGNCPMVQVRSPAEPRKLEEKLQASRKPIRKLVREDCVALGLLAPARAGEVARNMAGKMPQDAEAQIVAELRNNLHSQVRQYMREHKGGPWPKPKAQEELRLDIVSTRSVNNVLLLARQILRERTKWEAENNRGMISSLLGGRLKFGLGRRR